jgi:hypothetical protein
MMFKTTAAAVWVLVTVTNGGEVRQTPDFISEYSCRQAQSIVETGRTMEENRERMDRAAAESKKREEDWRAAHPPREPANDDERSMVKAWRENKKKCQDRGDNSKACINAYVYDSHNFSTLIPGTVQNLRVNDDGLIQEDRAMMFSGLGPGSMSGNVSSILSSESHKNEIKFAKCFMDKGESR